MTTAAADNTQIIGGVDTHQDLHTAAVVSNDGTVLGAESFSTTRAGYRAMLRWFRSHGELLRVGVESTGTYGAGITRHLALSGMQSFPIGIFTPGLAILRSNVRRIGTQQGRLVVARQARSMWPLLLRHGINATVERLSEEYRATVKRALIGRTASRAALVHGLPKEAIRSVINGHDPKLARADDVCRALGFTFLLGGPLDDAADEGDGWKSETDPRIERELVRDVLLAELVSRLADQWEKIPVRERGGVGLAIASILDIAGAKGGASLDRVVEDLGWRVLEEETQPDRDSEGKI